MERGVKPAKAKVEAKPPVPRKSPKIDGSMGSQLEQRLTEALEQQTATSDILRVISQSPTDVQPVFDTIVVAARKLCGATSANVFTFDGELIHLAAFVNVGPDYVEAMRQFYPRPPGRDTGVTRAIQTCNVVVIPDVVADREYAHAIGAHSFAGDFRSVLAVPLVREGSPIGAIAIGRPEPGPFPDKQVALLKTFADQAVIAIENVRLFNETKEALEQQTATAEILKVIAGSPTDVQPVFDVIVESAVRLCGARFGRVYRYDGSVIQMVAGHGLSTNGLAQVQRVFPRPAADDTIVGRVILTRRPLYVRDIEREETVPALSRQMIEALGTRSQVTIPMLRAGEPIGAITMGWDEPEAFDDQQVALLQTFADQAVIAIENVRLFNETKEALEQQTATGEILRAISSSPTQLQPVLEAVVSAAARFCGAPDVMILRVDGAVLRGAAGVGQFAEIVRLREGRIDALEIPISRGSVSGRAVHDRRSVHVHDLAAERKDEYPIGRELQRRFGHHTCLATPLLREGVPLGVIGLFRMEAKPFSEKQIELLRTFADQAVIAIENVRLFTELEARTLQLTRSVGELKALGEVGQAVSSTLDLETVLSTIVSRATQLAGMDGGSIWEYDETREEFYLHATDRLPDELVEVLRATPIRKGEGALGRLALTGEPVEIRDIVDERSYQSRVREILIRCGYRSVLAVPLLREGHLLGALAVNRNSPNEFAPEVIDLLKTFATQSALAIQNARLFREIEEKGRQLEVASRHKSDFLASMSHELRTPLNAILGFNEMLLGQVYGEVPVDMQAPLAQIQTSGKHLLRLINNVLDLAKIEAGRMELALSDYSVHDTVESVRSTLRPLAADKGLEFVATVPADIPLAYGDCGRITQCLMNLAGNSLKFTKAGKVEITVEYRGDLLVFRVADTGIGIPPDMIGSLFTEFKQTDATIASEYGGTGLGLSISRKFVEMHGGRIWVESELGNGSAFIFEIPLRASAGAQA